MATHTHRLVRRALTCGMLLSLGCTLAAQPADPTAALVARAGAYVLEYERRLTGIIAEERQTQRLVKASGAVSKQRILVSDVMFVAVGDATRYFRDVLVVDGRPVRDRQERLHNLFLRNVRDPVKQAHAIFEESRRYDLKFMHWVSALLLPTTIVKPGTNDRFQFAATDDGVSFDEVRSPTLARAGRRNKMQDQPLRGWLSIDPSTGALRAATIRATNATLDASVDVRYAEDTGLGLLIPVQVRETYRQADKPSSEHMEISSDYSNVRRFEVTVEQTIELPQ